jgi:hypothetical protein
MTPRYRKVVVFVGTAALAAGAGIGVAAQGDSTTANQSGPGMTRPGDPGGGGFDLSALADELGVSETRLQEAMQAARPSAGGGAGPTGMAEALADELNLSVTKVQDALEATRPQGSGPPNGTAPPQDGGQTTPQQDTQTT